MRWKEGREGERGMESCKWRQRRKRKRACRVDFAKGLKKTGGGGEMCVRKRERGKEIERKRER